MRWVTSSSSDVISFYSLADGVQHVLPFLGVGDAVGKCIPHGSNEDAAGAQTSLHLRRHQQQQSESAEEGRSQAADSFAALERSRRAGTACARYSPLSGSNNSGSKGPYHQPSPFSFSTEGGLLLGGTTTSFKDSHYGSGVCQQSLGYVTTCVFSGGWGGYDETEVTVGTTEGYVYALPALWPPSAAYDDAHERGERRAASARRSCCSASEVSIDEGGSTACLHVPVADGASAAGRAVRDDEREETYSLPFPTSYVATPVKRFLRLPYTVQHLQMLGAHTPTLAGEYHDELLWLQQQPHRQRRSAARRTIDENGVNVSEAEERRFMGGCCSHGCGNPSCVACVSCCCFTKPLLSTYSEHPCTSYSSLSPDCHSGSSGTSSAAHASSVAAPAASTNSGQRSGHFASRVQQFFSSDRLLLALDKGGNGVVAHWPAPQYLLDSPLAAVTSAAPGRSDCSVTNIYGFTSSPGTTKAAKEELVSEGGCVSEAASTTASTPLAASFSLNLSVQCCASNPIVTPLLAVVPSVVAAGGLRLLSVFDLVTTSFVFYARPPLTPGRRLPSVEDEEQQQRPCPRQRGRQHHSRNQRHAHAGEARFQLASGCSPPGRVWANVCCLSSSPSVGAALRQPGGARVACGSTSRGSASTGRGLPVTLGATAARNMPVRVSSLTWLPALHPLLLGASTNSGLLLLYDLRASPHPVFCAARSPPARTTGSVAPHAGDKGAPAQTTGIPCGFTDAVRKPWNAKQATLAPPLAEERSAAPEAGSTAGKLPGAAGPMSSHKAWPSEALDRHTFAGHMTDNDTRRGRSLALRNDGKAAEIACERKREARRVSRSSSRRSGGKRRRIFAEDGRDKGKAVDEEPMSISFLATPAWLTSAATSHDAAILPCGCRCCQARAAMVRNVEAPACVLVPGGASAALPVTSTHQNEEMKESSAGPSGQSQDPTRARHTCSSHGQLKDEYHHEAAGHMYGEIGVGAKGIKEVSLFGGCAANVVIKPRNSSRPRPEFRKRAGAKRGSFFVMRRPGRTASMMHACCSSAEMPTHLLGCSKEFPDDASHWEGCALPCKPVPAAGCAEIRTVRGDRRRRSRTNWKTRDTSWRKRWFAKQEKAIINFFCETYRALLSRGSGSERHEAAVAATVGTGISKARRAVDPLSCRNLCHGCSVCPSVNCTTESALSDSRPALRSDVGKEEQEKDPPANGERSSSRSQPLLFAGKTGTRAMSENGGATETAGGVPCAASARPGDLASHSELRPEMLSSLRLPRSGVSAGTHTSGELPFYLLRLASSPCSVLSGFPCLLWSSNQVASLPSCRPFTQSPFRFPDISVAYVASCFFSVFARLLYAHRLDQHAAARRLSHHQERQLLKLLHAVDCTDRAILSQRPSAVDAAISAAAAAESAVAEAHSAAVAARAAGVDVTTTAGAAAAGSDAVQAEASSKAGVFLRSSVESLPAKRRSLQGVIRTEESSNNLIGESAAFQGILLSAAVCSSSSESHSSVFRSPESVETLCTRETATRLPGFEKKLLSLYADVLLNRSCRAVPRTAYSEKSSITFPVRDTIEKILPEFYRRHAQNCIYLLRYAADVLYAFGDGAPVLAQNSAAAGKAVQAAAACATSLESEGYLFGVSGPAGGFSAGFSADDLMTPLSSRDCAAARGKQEETFKPDGIATEQASNDAQEGQLRCGCGRIEAAVKAKARRWLADEFITEARLAMRTSRSKRSFFTSARKRTECSTVTKKEDVLGLGERECDSAEDFVAEAHIVAAAHAVASSICVCELFHSATFFPVLFFNIFRGLCHGATGIPFCIQKNCIRSLPISDLAYQKLARSQLRQLTRKRCRKTRVSGTLSPGRQTQFLGNDVCDQLLQEGRTGARAKCPPSSTDCVENVCWWSCVRGTLPDHASAAEDFDRFGRASCDLSRRLRKDQTRTQQLLCLDERGRVYVLSVSLRVTSGPRSKHGSDMMDRVHPAGGDAPSLPGVGRLVNGRMASHCDHKLHEGHVADGPLPQPRETCVEHHSARSKWNEGAQERVPANLSGVNHTQLLNAAVCTSRKKPTCATDAADGHVVTDEQGRRERRCLPSYFERACWPECVTMRKNLLWGPEGTEEVLQLENNEQDFFCRNEREDGFRDHNNVHKKMWNQRWLCRRRRIEWCGACRPVASGTSCTIPGTSESVRLVDAEKSVNSVESKHTSCTSGMWRSYGVKCQEHMSGGDDTVSAEATGDSTVSQPAKKLHLGRSRPSSAARGCRAIRKKGKRSARFIKENDESAIAQRVTSTAAAAGLAQINASRCLLRLFPRLPLWNSCSRPQYVWRWIRKLHGRCCSQNRIPTREPWTKTHSHVNSKCPQRKDGGRAAFTSQTEERCKLRSEFPTRALGISSMLKEVSNAACSGSRGASIAQVLHTDAPRPKEECREGAFYVASDKKIDTSIHNQPKEEKRSEFCRRICCRLQVEEEASFDINGKTNHGHLGSDSCRSRVVSLAIHENGRYVLAATCAPSFLLYSSSPMGPLPPYEHKDRLLFGCATGTVPPSRPFRLISVSRGASFSGAASMCPSDRGVPTVLLPGAPSGPRPPSPVLISASPILPPGAAAPFVPHTLLRRQVDHGVPSGLSCDGSVSTRRLVRCRPGPPVSLGRQSAHVECGGCGRRSGDPGQAAFSDWLTDEEDEKELHGGASGSETGSASDA